VDVTPSASRFRPKKSFWFDVRVSNGGPNATSASLTVQLAGSPSNLTENHSSCSLQAQTMTCAFVDLGVASSVTVRITGTAPNKGTVSATALIDGAADDPNGANDQDSASVQVR
jgi:hypothetical protein